MDSVGDTPPDHGEDSAGTGIGVAHFQSETGGLEGEAAISRFGL